MDDFDNLLLEKAICQQDGHALSELYCKYRTPLRHFISQRVGSVSEVDDLTQDVFLQLCRHRGRKSKYHSPRAYIFGIAAHLASQHLRDKKKAPISHPIHQDMPAQPSKWRESDQLWGQLESGDLRALLDELPAKAGEAVRLRVLDGLDSEEATRIAQCSKDVLYRRLYEGVRALRLKANRRRREPPVNQQDNRGR